VVACGGEESSESSRRSQEGWAKAVSVTGLFGMPSHRIEVGGRQRAQGVVHVRTLPEPRTQRVFLCVCWFVWAGGCRIAMRARESGRGMTGQIVCKRGIACVCVIMNCGDGIATMRGSRERRVRVWTRRTSRRACV
jgi:hypothetical protein